MLPPKKRTSQFIQQFAGPGDGSNVVCFKFWQLKHAMGCPFECSYCFLQTTPYFVFNRAALKGQVYSNMGVMLEELDEWLADPVPKMLLVGELQDGLAFEEAHRKVNGAPLTHLLIPRFAAQSRHRLVFLTKSTAVRYALELPPTSQVVFSWSVNAEYAAASWEKGTPLPSARLQAALRMRAAGWPVRFRLDPMVPFSSWQAEYGAIIDEINKVKPEMVTLGALRATSPKSLRTNAIKNGRDPSVFDYLTEERDSSGFKYRIPFETQVEMFKFAIERLDAEIAPALCKEDSQVWRRVGLRFAGCHCLLGAQDSLVGASGKTHEAEG